ncbi:MAG: hypothetical protein JRH15_10185 [Deltaproteobacteria bacterium]|nr:hypothetical protein [Deltaproteobacteria bacterium]
MLPEYFEFSLPTKLVYGIGILGNITDTIKPFGKRKAILVTDDLFFDINPLSLSSLKKAATMGYESVRELGAA